MANVITNLGMTAMLKKALGLSGDAQLYLAAGTGATPNPSEASTGLVAELSPRLELTNAVSGSVATLEGFATNSQWNGTLTEWGIFSAASGGNLLVYGVFAPSVVKTSAHVLTVTITEELDNA